MDPLPPQAVHLEGAVPGLHLLPLQVVQVPFFSYFIYLLVPFTDSLKEIFTFKWISYPFLA